MLWPSSTIIEHLSGLCRIDRSKILAYWYFNFRDERTQNIDNLLRSLIRQLGAKADALPQAISELRNEYKAAGTQPGTKTLALTLDSIIASLEKNVFIVIDALDECPEKAKHARRQDLLNQIKQLLDRRHENLHILATSKREVDISASLENTATAIINIEDSVEYDVRLLVQRCLKEDERLKIWKFGVKSEIETRLAGAWRSVSRAYNLQEDSPAHNSTRGFRWAALQLEKLSDCNDEDQIMEALRDIPATLEETYEQALTEIPEKDTERARSILLWLVFSLRPLTLEEVAAVVKLPRSSDVLRICTSKLVTLSQQDLEICNCTTSCKVVQLAHSSVREYLVSDKLKTSENKKASSFFVSMDLAHVKSTAMGSLEWA